MLLQIHIRRLSWISVLIAGFGPWGCGSGTTVRPLDRDSNASILQYHQPVVPDGHKDYALGELQRGLLFFDLGNYLDADARFANALQVMAQIAGDDQRETAAVLWAESAKTYRGEPFERATAHLYRGLCRYYGGDWSGALAAFRSALACDAETRTKDQKKAEDFTIAHFMTAMCYLRMDERDNAENALLLARQYAPGNPYLSLAQLQKPLVAIIPVGVGPYLRPSRLDVSIKRVDCPPCQEAKVEMYVDGKLLGEATETSDLFEQAKSQGWGEMDSVRVCKAVARRVVSYIPYASLLTNLIRSEADLRCWTGLPRKFYIITGDVAPGLHTITLKFYDANGQCLERYGQVWFDVPIAASGSLMYLRSFRNYQNIWGREPQSIARKE